MPVARRMRLGPDGLRRVSPYLLAGLLAGSGVSHFVATDAYAATVPLSCRHHVRWCT